MNKILPDLIKSDLIREVIDPALLNSFRGDLTMQRSYKNGLGYPVVLVDRDNIEYLIHPLNAAGSITHEFKIVETISFSSLSVNINAQSLSNALESSPKAVAINKSLEHNLALKTSYSQFQDRTVITIEYILSANTFASKRHAVYLDELDISVCKQGIDYQVVHPYSPIGQSLIVKNSHNENGFNYVVLINDPDDIFGTRYVNIANRVFRVRVAKDRSMKPGVYIYTKGGNIDLSDYSERELVEEFSFAEADEKVPLFKTPALAKDFGDAHLTRVEELKAKEAEVKIKEAEFKKLKADVELEKAILDGKLKTQEAEFKKEQLEQQIRMKQLEDELFREKLQRDRLREEQKYHQDRQRDDYKYHQDMNTMKRKDASEFLKWLPGVVTSVIGIITLILQIKAKVP